MADWPLTGDTKRAFVVVNESAGGVGPGARDALTKALSDSGFQKLDVREKVHKLDSCHDLAMKADVIVVLGGDGTARAAAEAFGDGPPMIILPGGTLNVLPHALYGDRNWPDALRDALAGGRVQRLVCGKANDTRFFVAALFGAPTLLATAREAVREGKLLTAVARFRGALERTFTRPIEVRADNTQTYTEAPAVGVLCPAYVGEVQSDSLEFVRLEASKFTDLARVGLRAMIGGWRDDTTIELSRATGGRLRSAGVIPGSLDGEPHVFVSKVRIEIVRNGPRVVVLD